MTALARTSVLSRLLAPGPFLAGLVCAFVGCCLAGWASSRSNVYRNFVRFHTFINAQTLYYPTSSQVRALGRSRLHPDKVAVIVGGNSILFGHGQGQGTIWTQHLQEVLGDNFQVINLALPAALPAEFGEVAAEMIERDHPKLLFVTVCGTSGIPILPDGHAYRYFYWDAEYKGLIPHDDCRSARLAIEAKLRAREGGAFAELQRGARLDSGLWFQDLWTTVAHEHLSTVWTRATAEHFTRARKHYVEPNTPEPPLQQRYPASLDEPAKAILRQLIHTATAHLKQGPDGCSLNRLIHESFPEPCRKRTLMLIPRDSPHYVAQLSSAERAAYVGIFPGLVSVLEADGMPALAVGADYSERDFMDRCHLSGEGGRRLAGDIAPKLRAMAESLGYLK